MKKKIIRTQGWLFIYSCLVEILLGSVFYRHTTNGNRWKNGACNILLKLSSISWKRSEKHKMSQTAETLPTQ